MFSFFQKKNIVSDIAWLGVDIHSHLLPGIDDGAEDMAQSVRYISSLEELGFSKLLCTPHIFPEMYDNSPETILPVLAEVTRAVSQAGLKIEMGAAAEYMTDATFTACEGLLTLPNNYILIEMSYIAETNNIDQIIFELQLKGYKVILAHPERYRFYHQESVGRFQRFKDQGCFLQLNLLSVVGYYGKQVQQTAEMLIKSELYDFAGTDLHHDKHLSTLTSAVQNGVLHKKIGNYPFGNKEIFS